MSKVKVRMRTDWRTAARLALFASLTMTMTAAGVGAQEPDAEEMRGPDPTELALGRAPGDPGEDLGWSNATELSVVRTAGNAETQTFGFKNTLRRNWNGARARLRFDGIRARAAGDRFLVVEPGLRFRPGEQPDGFEIAGARAAPPPDVEQYFVEGRFESSISERFFWNVGTSWDRNHDAGIRNRHVAFGGVGNTWADTEDLSFSTGYGISYTSRDETEQEAGKDHRFGGFRLDGDYHHRLGGSLELDTDLALNVNLRSVSDHSLNVTNALGVAMNEHLSLRVSLQHLFENRPALEEAPIVARVTLLDPDGTPGSGDELFETVADGGVVLDFGTGRVRKAGLDAIFRTALVISF